MKTKTKTKNIDAIRRAVHQRHGGFETASDREIMDFWRTLDRQRRAEYLALAEHGDLHDKTITKATKDTESTKESNAFGDSGQKGI